MGGTTIGIPSELQEKVEAYRKKGEFDSFADAARKLIRVGLEEEKKKREVPHA